MLSEVDDALCFVLSRTSHPGNIGSAARAIRTMGFSRLRLVAPAHFPDPQATALAVGAPGVLQQVQVHAELGPALADCHVVIGLSARRRGVALPELGPRAAAREILRVARAGQRVALLFGNEANGLDNAELSHCQQMVRIPSVTDFSSLNLAQAVQVMAYELRLAQLERQPAPAPPDEVPATAAQLEQYFTHLEQVLERIDFHKGRSPKTVMLRLRRFYQRAHPEARELRILHGILADTERIARSPGAAANASGEVLPDAQDGVQHDLAEHQ